MSHERPPTGPAVGAGRRRGRVVPDGLLAGRADLLVLVLLAVAIGDALLAPSAGAKPPAREGSLPAEGFARLDVAVLEDLRSATERDDAGAETRPGAGPSWTRASAVGVDEWGLTGLMAPGSGPAATLVPWPPEVVRFRPRDGWTDVDRDAELSVRFTAAMDHASTEAAFHASIGATEVTGTLRWAEGDTVLVLRPAAPLPYGQKVELRVDADAHSAAGQPVAEPAAVSFTVEPRPAAPPAPVGTSSSGWQWPLLGPITQRFGQTLTEYGFHQGIDVDGDTGDPVRAARAGVVVVAGHADECGGLQVRIDHGGGLLTWYRHLSAIETAVGARVPAGTVIGRVGATGCAFGSHLHFGVSDDGEFVDPLRYLPR